MAIIKSIKIETIIYQILTRKKPDMIFFNFIDFDKLKEKINFYSKLTLMQSIGYHS